MTTFGIQIEEIFVWAQSPCQPYKKYDHFNVEYKYTHSQFDHCVYFQCLDDGSFIYFALV